MKIRNVNGHAAHLHGIGVVKPGQSVEIAKTQGALVLAGRGWELVEDDPKPKPAKAKEES